MTAFLRKRARKKRRNYDPPPIVSQERKSKLVEGVYKIQVPIYGDTSCALAYTPDQSELLHIPMEYVTQIRQSLKIPKPTLKFYVFGRADEAGVIHVTGRATEEDFISLEGVV